MQAEIEALPGLAVLRAEMARQYGDGRTSFDEARTDAAILAGRIRETGRLVMLGMGASHWVNRMVLPSYRAARVDASAEVLSEALRAPLPVAPRVTLLASQSGGSGEIAAYFAQQPDRTDHFGLTLNADSLLGEELLCLIGRGGREKAFAATRTILVTLCLHAAVLAALGEDVGDLLRVLNSADPMGVPARSDAHDALQGCSLLVLASRGALHAVCEAASLTFMELSRVPALPLELGQLIHGPLETLAPGMALLLARPLGPDATAVTSVAELAVSLGLKTVLFDLGAHPPVNGATIITLPRQTGLAAVATLLPALQRLAIEAAAARIGEGFGTPLRSSKVTDGEAPGKPQ